MDQVPNIISTKDLSYLSDMISWNLTISKKAHHYVGMVEDSCLKEIMMRVYEAHKKHINTLLSILEEGN